MITHTFLLSLSIAACQSKRIKDVDHYYPAAPNLNKITSFGGPPYGISVEWQPVEFRYSGSHSGYKVKMWESEKVLVWFKDNGVWTKKYVPEQSLHSIPNTNPIEQIVGVYETTARFEGLKLDVDYQVRVQAFDRLHHGPYSNALSIKLLSPGKPKKNIPIFYG